MTADELRNIRAILRARLSELGITGGELERRIRARGASAHRPGLVRLLRAKPCRTERMLADILEEIEKCPRTVGTVEGAGDERGI